jgi:hypothetical protein
MSKRGIDTHDASFWLPANNPDTLKGLDRWLLDPQRLKRITDDQVKIPVLKLDNEGNLVKEVRELSGRSALNTVAQRWAGLTTKERALPFDKIVARALSNPYSNVVREDFAEISALYGVPAGNKEGEYGYNEHRFLASLNTPSPFPTVPAQNSKWTGDHFAGIFLPRNDVRGLNLGHISSCCQNPGKTAATAAWHGQESPRGGFFVVVKKDNPNTIVAQSWMRITPDGGLLGDSIEGRALYSKKYDLEQQESLRSEVSAIYQQMADELTRDRFHTVAIANVGNAGIHSSKWNLAKPEEALAVALEPSYTYSDARAKNQRILATNAQKWICP